MRVRGELWRALRHALTAFTAMVCALALAQPAWANVYCVNEPACVAAGGTEAGTNGNAVQKALEAAEKHTNTGGVADEVVIGAGAYTRTTEGYSYGGSEAVTIHGAGAGSTTLSVTGKHTTMSLTGVSSTALENLTVEVPAEEDVTGLSMTAGTVRGVRIAGQNAGASSTGLELKGGEFTTGSIAMPAAASSETTDVSASLGGILTNASLEGGEYGIQASNFPLIRGCRIAATRYGLVAYASGPIVEDTLFDLGGKSSYGIYLDANSANATGRFNQLTIVNGDTSAIGILAGAESKHAASVTLENSIIAGIGRPLSVTTDSKAGTSSAVTTNYTSYEVEKAVKSGTGATITDENVSLIPGEFVSPVTGGDWRLLADSPLLGLGSPKTLQAGEYEFDAGGNPRIVNGQRDLGAYENQRRPPLARAVASASSAEVGAAVTFDGAGSSVQEAGDSIASYEWAFDDGATANGAEVTHAFATPGLHTATLTVTDVMGTPLRAQASVSVEVLASPALQQHGRELFATIVAVRLHDENGLSSLKLSPRAFRVQRGRHGGAAVSYRLAKRAKVKFWVQRRAAGVKHGGFCVRRIRSNADGKRCKRWADVPGDFKVVGNAGTNSLHFSGRMGGKRLAPGSYLLLANASGAAITAPFRITG